MWQMFCYKSRILAIEVYLSSEQAVFMQKSYFCFCSVIILAKKRLFVQLGTRIELLIRISNTAPLILCVHTIHEMSIPASSGDANRIRCVNNSKFIFRGFFLC
jgi:hypothetical protein